MSEKMYILVIGAGIAGTALAKRLSQAGRRVYLIEKQAVIGGHAAGMGCKAADVCLRCNVCVANEIFKDVACSKDIRIHTRTELLKLEPGENGSRYVATLKHEPTFIDRDKCFSCQACLNACPEKCITKPETSFSPMIPVVDFSLCRLAKGEDCSICKTVCPADAITMDQKESESKINVDSIVVATGHEPFDPVIDACYGYGGVANVITGIEAERQLAAQNKLTRPSDGETPKRIAFVQCVGSRSEQMHRRPEDTDYCSVVCCAYALRMAKQFLFHNDEAEVTVFYMDIQNFGKDFDKFYKNCKKNMTFVRSRPYEIKQGPNDTALVKFTEQLSSSDTDTQVSEQEFDLVVLSVGIRPAEHAANLAEKLLVPVDERGFFGLKNAAALPALQRKGIFVAGTCESPKDIQSCIRQGEAVAAAILNDQ